MTDDGIREKHGVSCADHQMCRSSVLISEREETILIDACYSERNLTEWQARYLASKLYRLARRLRARRA